MNSDIIYFPVANLYVLTDEVLDMLLSNDIFDFVPIEGELNPPG